MRLLPFPEREEKKKRKKYIKKEKAKTTERGFSFLHL